MNTFLDHLILIDGTVRKHSTNGLYYSVIITDHHLFGSLNKPTVPGNLNSPGKQH